MKNKFKILALIMAMLLILTSCGGGTGEEKKPEETGEKTETEKTEEGKEEVVAGEPVKDLVYPRLQNREMESYAVFKAKLSIITSKMNYFIYRIKKNDIPYYDRIGELYYVENGDAYFTDGKLDTEKFETQIGIFIQSNRGETYGSEWNINKLLFSL